jgi:hypothetical protein
VGLTNASSVADDRTVPLPVGLAVTVRVAVAVVVAPEVVTVTVVAGEEEPREAAAVDVADGAELVLLDATVVAAGWSMAAVVVPVAVHAPRRAALQRARIPRGSERVIPGIRGAAEAVAGVA